MQTALQSIRHEQLKDQFSDTTRTVRRNLLIAACVAILLSLPGVGVSGFLGVTLDGAQAKALAVGAVGLIAAYELVSFCVYAVIDHRRWSIVPGAVLINDASEQLSELRTAASILKNHAANLDLTIDIVKRDPRAAAQVTDKSLRDLQRYVDGVLIGLANHDSHVAVHRRQLQAHNVLQLLRIYLLDWGVPLLVGGFCLSRTWVQMNAVLVAVLYGQMPAVLK